MHKELKRYFFHCPGMIYAFDIWAKDKKEVREYILNFWGVKRLPNHTAIWLAGE